MSRFWTPDRPSRKFRNRAIPHGPQRIDLSRYPNMDHMPPQEGLIDAYDVIPRHEDKMGVFDGKLCMVEFRGPDISFEEGGGRRGAAWRDMGLTGNVACTAPFGGGMTGALFFNTTSEWFAISTWQWPANGNYLDFGSPWILELGAIGYRQADFAYMDLTINPNGPYMPDTVMTLRAYGGEIALEVDGIVRVGPAPIPAGLVNSSKHGLQIDYNVEHVGVGPSVHDFYIDNTPFPTPPVVTFRSIGTPVESVGVNNITVPYPAVIAAGDTLVMLVSGRTGGSATTPAGWTNAGAIGTSPKTIMFTKPATGLETGSVNVTMTTGDLQAVMMSFDQVWIAAGGPQAAATGTSASPASGSIRCYGPRRELIWVCAANANTAVTPPPGWTVRSAGVNGATNMRLAVATRSQDSMITGPFSSYGGDHLIVPQVGTLAASATWSTGVVTLNPGF